MVWWSEISFGVLCLHGSAGALHDTMKISTHALHELDLINMAKVGIVIKLVSYMSIAFSQGNVFLYGGAAGRM
jgi:hypothetical protein